MSRDRMAFLAGFLQFSPGIVGLMNLVESIERGLKWLSTPRWIPGRLEMETKRGQRLELEIVSFSMRVPIRGAVVRVPLFIALMPAGSSPIQAEDESSGEDSN